MGNPKDEFIKYLKKEGLKLTPEREAVLDGVFSIHKHFNADELYDKIRAQNKRISRASVYRTLPLLVNSGLVNETLRCQGTTSYEHTYGHEHHDHLVCIKCGKIIEFKEDKIEELQDAVCKRYGFLPTEHKLGIKGYCKKCR
jgi:Fur family ferric uptake transcriptional regulator